MVGHRTNSERKVTLKGVLAYTYLAPDGFRFFLYESQKGGDLMFSDRAL